MEAAGKLKIFDKLNSPRFGGCYIDSQIAQYWKCKFEKNKLHDKNESGKIKSANDIF